jgi:hypothetical protein
VDAKSLHQRIIECTWDQDHSKWRFLRVREDKSEPNAAHVYTKVIGSIHDNIQDGELLSYLEACFVQVGQRGGGWSGRGGEERKVGGGDGGRGRG